ncbi:MAG: LPS-assembly protein LptD [Candidatus Fermentibacteraceae bacterium]|nr:LPS-assembly protein LptD [Candidatus Fermentibacteraceae bacterium]MBN2608283.1 LPS-assembly protein LptD [Candidatus Fermentibacteraceae bacterium]
MTLPVIIPLVLMAQPAAPDSLEADTSSVQGTLETIAYSADSLVFHPGDGDLTLVGAVSVDYRDMTLHSDTVEYSSDDEVIVARGASELFDRGESITGSGMIYNINTRKGRILEAASEYDFGFYSGASITRVGRNEFNIVDARFTTCDAESTHFHFYCPVMKVFPDDKAIARPVYLYVENTPVFYFPYWVFPIRRGRQPGFTMPKFGQTSRDGRYLREMGYYFVFSDYSDLWVHGDIMEKTRFVVAADERHRVRYLCNGGLRTEWRREFQTRRDRWLVFGQHLHDFPDGTSLRLQGEFLSDRSYLEETQQNPEDRMTGEVRSWVSVNRYFGRLSFQGVLDRTSYLNTDPDTIPGEIESVQEAPDIRLSLPSAPLFRPPSDPSMIRPWHSIYWNASAHYLSRDMRMEENRATNSAFRATSGLTASSRLWGWLALSPSIQVRGTVYDRDRNNESYPWWLHGSAGLTASTDIYGIFGGGIFGLDALRHTITPSVSIQWAPDRFINGDGIVNSDSAGMEYYSFSDFYLPSSRRTVGLNLLNTLEGKRSIRGQISRFDIASLNISTSIDLEAEERAFSPLTATLDLNPLQALDITGNGGWDLYENEFTDLSVSSSLRLAGYDRTLLPDSGMTDLGLPIRMTLSHFYRHGLQDSPAISKFRLTASLDLTPGWSLEYSAYYDALSEDFISQSYTLRRDLHCWEAVFVRHISDVDSGFYFKINILDVPDIKIEQHVSNF